MTSDFTSIQKFKNSFQDSYSNFNELLDEYDFQKSLTDKLDQLNIEDFNRELLYEIVLWKLNRYPEINHILIEELKEVSKLQPKKHSEAENILRKLLMVKGIRLPMASTILRFLNPEVFQIIDDRAFRIACPGEKVYPTKPTTVTEKYLTNSVDIYFKYLDKLRKVSEVFADIEFRNADRILYLIDIKLGNKIGD